MIFDVLGLSVLLAENTEIINELMFSVQITFLPSGKSNTWNQTFLSFK